MALIDVIGLNKAPIEQSRISDEITGGLQAGIGLATAKEQVEKKKLELEEQKTELITKQASSANSLLTNLARANPMVAKKMLPQIREKLINLGVDPSIADYTISDDANRQRQIVFNNMAGGKLTQDKNLAGEYFQSLSELVGYDKAVQIFDDSLKRDQENKKMSQQDKQFYAGLEAQKEAAGLKRGGLALTPGQVQADKEFAKTYEEFSAAGGKKGVEADLGVLKEAKERIEQGEATRWAGAVPRFLRGYAASDTANVQDTIENVLVKSLKTILGGAFTEKDREAIVKNAFDPSQTPENNAKQLQLKIDEIQARYDAKMEAINEYEKKGTISTLRVGGNKTAGKSPLKEPPNKAKAQAALEKARAAQAGR